jgi:hypothetical protein
MGSSLECCKDPLPEEYERSIFRCRKRPSGERCGAVFVGTSLVTGWLVLSVIWLPAVVLGYCLVRLFRRRKVELPPAATPRNALTNVPTR